MRPRLLCLLVLLTPLSACEGGADPSPPAAPARGAPSASAAGELHIPTAGADSARGVVYVPAYSHIFHSDSTRSLNLAATLSIRNTDPERPIRLLRVEYYDNDGRRVRSYLEQPRSLGPMASVAYVVDRDDTTGGVGANFIVEWRSDASVTEPLMEAVMISTSSAQGVSFTSRGQTLLRR